MGLGRYYMILTCITLFCFTVIVREILSTESQSIAEESRIQTEVSQSIHKYKLGEATQKKVYAPKPSINPSVPAVELPPPEYHTGGATIKSIGPSNEPAPEPTIVSTPDENEKIDQYMARMDVIENVPDPNFKLKLYEMLQTELAAENDRMGASGNSGLTWVIQELKKRKESAETTPHTAAAPAPALQLDGPSPSNTGQQPFTSTSQPVEPSPETPPDQN